MSNKVILIILDGLNYTVAHSCMGYLNALTNTKQATLYKVKAQLPSLSRPLYECLLTGKTPLESQILSNETIRVSKHESVFSLARKNNLTTAAAAYYWFSELYNRAPYLPIRDRYTKNLDFNIQAGHFYHQDNYPDEHLFLDANNLICESNPDFLLVHPMNIDLAGHNFGGDSKEYRDSARNISNILTQFIPLWSQDYQIIITSDHGMHHDGNHGGSTAAETDVPCWVLGDRFSHKETTIKQTQIAGLICALLNIKQHNLDFNSQLLKSN